MDVEQFQHQFQVVFNDQNLLKQAFTHSYYVNEHRQTHLYYNERLELLWYAVLELGVSQFIYKYFGEMPEGEMTKLRSALVCEASLANFAKRLNFGKYIRLGKGEEQTGGRTRAALLADVFESFLGALYLDQGYEQVLL